MEDIFGDIKDLWLDIINQNNNITDVIDVIEPQDDDELKEIALQNERKELANQWIDIWYLIEWMKDIAENATTVTNKWDVIDDYQSKLAALKQLKSMRKEANKVDKKDPVVFTFKPIFEKPPKLL